MICAYAFADAHVRPFPNIAAGHVFTYVRHKNRSIMSCLSGFAASLNGRSWQHFSFCGSIARRFQTPASSCGFTCCDRSYGYQNHGQGNSRYQAGPLVRHHISNANATRRTDLHRCAGRMLRLSAEIVLLAVWGEFCIYMPPNLKRVYIDGSGNGIIDWQGPWFPGLEIFRLLERIFAWSKLAGYGASALDFYTCGFSVGQKQYAHLRNELTKSSAWRSRLANNRRTSFV